jgi:glycine oxidase
MRSADRMNLTRVIPAQGASLTDSTRSFDVAWGAARRGMRVVVLERGELGGGTSRVAAGMIAPIAEADPVERPLLSLALRSARMYPEFVDELTAASGRDPGYLSCGTLLVARDRDEAEALDRELEMRRRLALDVTRLLPSEARRLEPGLAPAVRLALEIPSDRAIDPVMLMQALAQAIIATGGELRTGTGVDRIEVCSDEVRGVRLAGGELLAAPNVVIATGVWPPEGIPADARLPIRPVKGQIMRLHDPAGPGLLTRVLRMQGCYVVPRGDGRYVLGATMEERGFDTTVTARAVYELLRDAIELLPGLSELVIDELSAGLRPATPDNSPALGRGAIGGLHWATGHYRHGILLAPITAEIVAGSLAGEAPPPEFAPDRFERLAVGA